MSQEEYCRHRSRPQPGSRAETNSRGKELKFQRRKPSAGICLLESRGLHVFVFSKATEVEQLPGKISISLSVILGHGSSATRPRLT